MSTFNRTFSRTKDHFLTNVHRARAAGVEQGTASAVETALMAGNNYCQFNGIAQPLTEDYLVCVEDFLFDKAVELGKQNDIKWVGVVA